jgi:hypothetical protein
MIDRRVAQIFEAIAANADAARLVGRLTRGGDPTPSREMMRKIGEHVVAVLTREIQAATGYRWARPCDAQVAARFILGGLEKVANDAIERDETSTLRTKPMAAEIGALVFFGLAHGRLLGRAAVAAGDPAKERSRSSRARPRPASPPRDPARRR